MNLPRSLLVGVVVALAATALLGVVLERATRPEPPKKAALPPAPLVPKAIRTETFTLPKAAVAPPEVPPPPVYLEPEPPKAAPPKAEAPRPQDLCARHGRRKVYTRGGRSWRCRR